MDAVQKAESGHPGMPMGMADIAAVLWGRHLRIDPDAPGWPDRDRFVLSNGHGSMLLYSLLHLCGFPVGLDDIRSFRQWGSVTPGHPERDPHLGIETTTGPLGQGFGTAVGMAMAEAHLRAVFGPDLVDHRTFVFAGDGDRLPVSAFPVDGTWPVGTSRYEKRHLSTEIPSWDPAICIQCNKCVEICPHAVIRPRLIDPTALAAAPEGFITVAFRGRDQGSAPSGGDWQYTLQMSPDDCTGCALCVEVCPAKNKREPKFKAINMTLLHGATVGTNGAINTFRLSTTRRAT